MDNSRQKIMATHCRTLPRLTTMKEKKDYDFGKQKIIKFENKNTDRDINYQMDKLKPDKARKEKEQVLKLATWNVTT